MKATLTLLNVFIVLLLNAGNPIEEERSKRKNAETYDTNGKWDWRQDEDRKSYFNK